MDELGFLLATNVLIEGFGKGVNEIPALLDLLTKMSEEIQSNRKQAKAEKKRRDEELKKLKQKTKNAAKCPRDNSQQTLAAFVKKAKTSPSKTAGKGSPKASSKK